MTNHVGGLGQPGPRTYEQKGWQAEILKPLYVSLILGIVLNLFWCAVTGAVWLRDPSGQFITKYRDNPRDWFFILVCQWIFVGAMLFGKLTETFWDDDFTTLVGDHPMLGILPMRPLTRLFFFVWWLRQKRESKPNKHDAEMELNLRLKGQNEQDK